MRGRWLASGFVLASMSWLLPAAAAGSEETPKLSVRGSGEVRVAPDAARVELGVLAEHQTARGAQAEANEVAGRILAALAAAGIPAAQVQTSQLQLQPVYSRPPRPSPDPPRIVAYRASNVVAVRLLDLTRVGPSIDAGLAAGANRLEGLAFELQDELPVREAALTAAAHEARAKARAIARALELQLGPVLEVSEGGVVVQPPQPMERFAMAEAATAPTPVAPGEIVVRADVTLRYALGR